jgi:hypothetical protein
MSAFRYIAEPPDRAELIVIALIIQPTCFGSTTSDRSRSHFAIAAVVPAFSVLIRLMLVLHACFKSRTRLEADSLQSISASNRRTLSVATKYLSEAFHLTTKAFCLPFTERKGP